MTTRGLTIAEVIDKNKISSDRVWIRSLKVFVVDAIGDPVEELRLVNNDEDLTLSGELYTAVPFDLKKTGSSTELGTMVVTIQDQTRFIQTRLQLYQGGVGFIVEAGLTLVDDGAPTGTLNLDLVEPYKIINSSATDYVVNIELGAENPLNFLAPKRIQSKDRCSFVYKGVECGYAGAEVSCDFTLNGANGCVFHVNEQRFGAYKGIKLR